jgi:hypothetical protein
VYARLTRAESPDRGERMAVPSESEPVKRGTVRPLNLPARSAAGHAGA